MLSTYGNFNIPYFCVERKLLYLNVGVLIGEFISCLVFAFNILLHAFLSYLDFDVVFVVRCWCFANCHILPYDWIDRAKLPWMPTTKIGSVNLCSQSCHLYRFSIKYHYVILLDQFCCKAVEQGEKTYFPLLFIKNLLNTFIYFSR